MARIQLTTAGESHGPGLTALLTGLPAGLQLDFDFIARELRRRQHGYGRGRRMKIETDTAELRGGVRGGETLGSPISLWVENRDYKNWEKIMNPVENDPHWVGLRRVHSPRPGHTDLAGGIKYDRRDLRDILERASARETTARVAAGAILQLFLRQFGIEIGSGVRFLGPIGADAPPPTWEQIQAVDEESPLRAIDHSLEDEMVAYVDRMKEEGDTLGGAVSVVAHGVPVGLGSHVQWNEKFDGKIAQAMMSVPAVKAVEIGAGVTASQGPGSLAHDGIQPRDGIVWPRHTNRAGGSEGGITNGEDLVITLYKKPIATLRKGMPSVDLDDMSERTSQYERSDVTALPAAGVIGEAMLALVLADVLLEKIGGDSMAETLAHFEATQSLQAAWP